MILLDLANWRTSHSNSDLYGIDIMDISVMYIVGNVITKIWYPKEWCSLKSRQIYNKHNKDSRISLKICVKDYDHNND